MKQLEESIKNVCKVFKLGKLKSFEQVESGLYLKCAVFNTSKKDGYKFWFDEKNYKK